MTTFTILRSRFHLRRYSVFTYSMSRGRYVLVRRCFTRAGAELARANHAMNAPAANGSPAIVGRAW